MATLYITIMFIRLQIDSYRFIILLLCLLFGAFIIIFYTPSSEDTWSGGDPLFDNYDSLPDASLHIYNERNLLIKSICSKYGISKYDNINNTFTNQRDKTGNSPENSLMYLRKWSLLYCWIHKVASTSWNKIFFHLANKKVKETNIHEAAAVFRPRREELPKLFKSSVSFLFVRHPFERLVSAFRDKFETGSKKNWMYLMYAADILDIVEASMDKTDDYLKMIYKKVVRLPRPTFPQFVDYLLRTPVEHYNDHWLPYWLHCHLCDQVFDVVGKFETIQQDTQYIQGMFEIFRQPLQKN